LIAQHCVSTASSGKQMIRGAASRKLDQGQKNRPKNNGFSERIALERPPIFGSDLWGCQ
jgi:hypothetical protein